LFAECAGEKIENRSTLGEIIDKSTVVRFWPSLYIERCCVFLYSQ